jgi:hypothetical protein
VQDVYEREAHKLFWWGNLKEVSHLESAGADRRIILKWFLEKCDAVA